MKLKTQCISLEPRLDDLVKRVAEWRKTRRYARQPMPPELWDAAAALADRFSPNVLGRRLHICPTKIRSRLPRSGERLQAAPAGAGPKVLRLAPVVFEAPPQPTEAAGATVEIENAAGCKLRVTTTTAALTSLVKVFVGGAL